jgi:hypothetical protein
MIPTPLGTTRTVVHSHYALIAPDSHVPSVEPGWTKTAAFVLVSAGLGARLTQTLYAIEPGGRGAGHTHGDEHFYFVVEGECHINGEGMEAGVKGSMCVLFFLFKDVLGRPYCRFELRLARAHGVPVIALLEGEHYRETYSSVLELQSAFDKGELPADLKPVVDKADFNFFYRRQNHEQAAMISRLCEKLEAAMAPGDWPSFTQPPDASGNAVSGAYRMLDAELQARPATAAPSMQQPAPSNRIVEVSSALAGKRSLPTGGPA